MSTDNTTPTGGCFCGAVRYRVNGPLRGIVNCHCTQCQKLNGSFGAHSKALTRDIEMIHDQGLVWYQITDSASRGFCGLCGSPLFWEARGQSGTGIIAGTLDQADDLRTIGHIFVADKPGYCEINDALPQFAESSDGALPGDSL